MLVNQPDTKEYLLCDFIPFIVYDVAEGKAIYNFLKVEQWLPEDGGRQERLPGNFPEERNIVCCDRTLNDRGVCICQSSEPHTWDLYIFVFVVFIWKGKQPKQILYYHYGHAAAKIF